MQEKFKLSTTTAMDPQKILEILKKDYDNRLTSFSSVEELTRTIIKENFPKDTCQEVKILLLKIFIDRLEYYKGSKTDYIRENALPIIFCFYTLDDNPENIKTQFLGAILDTFSKEQEAISAPNYASGSDFLKWRKGWREDSLKNFTIYYDFDILMWPGRIKEKFQNDLKRAEKDQKFVNDYNDYRRIPTQD